MEKTYSPADHESIIYSDWENANLFKPKNCKDARETYCNILPPPNANGELHLGHASGYATMDLFGRFNRLRGKKTLLLPGKDHAGIQTQVVFEKKLLAERKLSRYDLGREKFFQECYDFCMDRSRYMRSQEKRIGLSADWEREKFTLDPEVSKRAIKTFVKMHDDNLLYRGERIINWCPRCATALSDIEVIHKETEGKLFHIKYPVKNSEEHIIVATTRPETLLGDTAVAVHPDDARYTTLVGKTLLLPLMNREIPVIADDRVDATFGTGAVKITPAHDPLDWAIAETHTLPVIQVIGKDAKMTSEAGKFFGLPAQEAREKILEELDSLGILLPEENHRLNISLCERCKTTIEPLVSKQWFVKVDAPENSLKQKAIAGIRNGDIAFYPETMKDQMIHWLENLHDWCISRQLWWGHRIPVWYCLSCKKERVGASVKSRWFFIRHGETDANKTENQNGDGYDCPLNENGRTQAQRAGEHLAHESIEVIFSSPFSRTRETAEIIGEKTGVQEIIFDERLRERHMGEAEGISYAETRERFPDIRKYDGKPANNESFEEAEHRIWKAVSEHLEKHHHKNVLIVSHGGTLRALWRKIKNIDPKNIMQIEKFANAIPLFVDILDPCEKCGGHFFEQDPDTLDTWFSSGQWPYTTLGYPEKQDAQDFYPTHTMIMGRDLLFFWAARMILFGYYTTKTTPFKNLYFTGLVRDEHGLKMSKSKGNGIDVLEMIDTFGADAVRMSLIVGATPGLDFRLSEKKISGFRNFVNKLWNIGRYVAQATETTSASRKKEPSEADHWILFHLAKTVQEVTRLLENYQFSLAGEVLREFTWTQFADWYVEIHKIEQNNTVLSFVFETLLKLWHPFMPFVTETLWKETGHNTPLMTETWPNADNVFSEIEKTLTLTVSGMKAGEFEYFVQEPIVHIRNIRAEHRISTSSKLKLHITGIPAHGMQTSEKTRSILEKNTPLFIRLARIQSVTFFEKAVEKSIPVLCRHFSGFLVSEETVDIKKEKMRLEKEFASLETLVTNTEKQLANPQYREKAPANIVAQREKLLEEYRAKKESIARQMRDSSQEYL